MTTPAPFSSRPVPDVADLRLLAEIINNGAVGLPQAAWNAGMSQSEAAARLVTMAERGMPLRLVAEGDRQQLWHIAQAGPVQPPPAPAGHPPPPVPPMSMPVPPVPPVGPITSPAPPVPDLSAPATGPVAAVEPDVGVARLTTESAGESGPPRVSTVTRTGPGTPDADSSAVWGVPGASSWVRPPEGTSADSVPEDETAGPDTAGSGPAAVDPDSGEPGEGAPASGEQGDGQPAGDPAAQAAEPAEADATASPVTDTEPSESAAGAPTRRVLTSGQPVQAVEGLFGEQLDVGLQQILDPADNILTAVGYRLDAGERALLVQTSVGNRGPADYESLADLYLEVVDAAGTVLRKAAMSVNGYPAHQVGVPANTLASGWTVFLVPVDTQVAQVRWSVRPDLVHRTVSWGFGPAPADRD